MSNGLLRPAGRVRGPQTLRRQLPPWRRDVDVQRVLLFLLVPLVGVVAALGSQWFDHFLIGIGAHNNLLEWWDDIVLGMFAAAITLGAIVVTLRARRADRARLEVIREVHHHVRNALQVVRLQASVSEDPEMGARVDDAIARIEWTMRDVLPAVNDPGPLTRQPEAQRTAAEWPGPTHTPSP